MRKLKKKFPSFLWFSPKIKIQKKVNLMSKFFECSIFDSDFQKELDSQSEESFSNVF